MKNDIRAFRPLGLAGLTVLGLATSAATAVESVSQPTPYAASNEGDLYQGSGSRELVGPNYFTATVEPFDDSLGTLLSFTIRCELDGALAGTVGTADTVGSASGGLGGTFFLGGISFDGTGGANGGGGATGTPLAVDFGIPTYDRTLLLSDAGVTYNPALVDVVTGSQPFEVLYQSAVNVNFANMEDLQASIAGSLTVTYTYEPAAGGIRTLRVIGVLRDTDAGQVSIEWASEAGRTYTVEATPDLSTGSWSLLDEMVTAEGDGTTTFTESVAAEVPRRFYRVREND